MGQTWRLSQEIYRDADKGHISCSLGLDLALLARNKAALEATQAESDDEDDVLEAAYGAGAGSADLPSAADDESTTGRKRSREEILAAVQSKRRALGRPVESSAPAASDLNRSKFKPIGFKEDKKAKKKVVVGPDGHVKKLKKKAKAPRPAEPDSAVAEPATALDIETAAVAPLKAEPSPAGPSSPPTAPAVVAAAPARSPPPPPAEKRFAKPLISANLSDDDIFGGVGEYEAELPSDSDEDDGEGAPKASTSKAATAVKIEEGEETTPVPKVNWFKTGRTPSPPPTPAGQIPSPKGKERAIDAGAADDRGGSRSPSPEPVMRLVPLSGTSAREMLARAEAAEQAAIRRSNKAKWRQSQGLAKQADGGEDDEDDEGQGGWRGKQKEETVDKKRLNHGATPSVCQFDSPRSAVTDQPANATLLSGRVPAVPELRQEAREVVEGAHLSTATLIMLCNTDGRSRDDDSKFEPSVVS